MTILNNLPVIKSYLQVPDDVPWDFIKQSCDRAAELPLRIAGEFSGDAAVTTQLELTADLEDWSAEYRAKVLELIKPLIYWTDKIDYQVVSQGAWFNRYRHGGKAEWHIHQGYVDLVVVWYLQADPDMGRYLFRYNDQEIAVNVNTGDILIFPGTLLHSTEVNTSQKERFLMANNICSTRASVDQLYQLGVVNQDKFDDIYQTRQTEIYKKLTT